MVVESSASERGEPLVVVPSRVIVMRDGPSRMERRGTPTMLSLELEIDLMLSRGPFLRMATVFA
jgi:hypothetical protein